MRNVLLHTILLLSPLIGTPRALLVPLSPPPPPSIDISNTAAAANDDLTTQDVSGNTECAAASTTTSFYLSFVSYGNYTALPGTGDDGVAPPQVVSMSFAVANAANGVYTVCAFPLGYLAGGPGTWVDDPSWQACADRRVRLTFFFSFFAWDAYLPHAPFLLPFLSHATHISWGACQYLLENAWHLDIT